MSYNDLVTVGPTLGFGESIDNPRSVVWNGNSTTANGNGFTNNKVFSPNAVGAGGPPLTGVKFQLAGYRYQTTMSTLQNKYVINDAITSKLSRYTDSTASGGYNNVVGQLITLQQLKNELRPTYEVVNTNYMVWYDYAVIKLASVFESLANIGLVRKFDCTLRLWFNTGTVNITVGNPNATNFQYSLTTANSTFTNTCPFMINYLNDTAANGGLSANTSSIVAGCYISKPPVTTFAGVNLQASGASSPLVAVYISHKFN